MTQTSFKKSFSTDKYIVKNFINSWTISRVNQATDRKFKEVNRIFFNRNSVVRFALAPGGKKNRLVEPYFVNTLTRLSKHHGV